MISGELSGKPPRSFDVMFESQIPLESFVSRLSGPLFSHDAWLVRGERICEPQPDLM